MVPAEQLCQYQIFDGLDEVELTRLSPLVSKRHFAQGAYIYYPGNPALYSYLVESGVVRLFFTDAAGEEYLLNLIQPPELFGHPMPGEDRLRLLGAAAHEPTTVLSIRSEDIFEMMDLSPRFLRNVYLDLAINTRRLLLHSRMIMTLSVNGRLATMILRMAQDGEHEKSTIDLPGSQELLGGWVGASRGRVNRALAHLQDMALIELDGHQLVILDRAGLERLTEEQTAEEP